MFLKIPESLEINNPYIKLGSPHLETSARMRFWPQNIKNLRIFFGWKCRTEGLTKIDFESKRT